MSSPKTRSVRSCPPLRVLPLGTDCLKRASLLEPCTSRISKPATSVCIRPTGRDHCALPPSACEGTYWSSVRASELQADDGSCLPAHRPPLPEWRDAERQHAARFL